tara:strand:+ start:4737 stop:5393 length:657 start_codon:yes stop_codon:yes gene_type:complete
MKKAIIFDNEWVIVKNDWGNVAKAISREFNVPLVSGKELKQKFRLYDKSKDNILYKWNRGEITKEEFWGRILLEQYEKKPTQRNINKLSSALELLTTKASKGTINLVKKLKNNGYKCFILSNSTPEIFKGNRERHSYFNYFDNIYLSFRTGFRKPEPGAYASILKDNNLKPEECVFIDDKPENLEGAEALGIDSIYYKLPQSTGKLKSQLKKKGCLIT